jgi:hypothetical protein
MAAEHATFADETAASLDQRLQLRVRTSNRVQSTVGRLTGSDRPFPRRRPRPPTICFAAREGMARPLRGTRLSIGDTATAIARPFTVSTDVDAVARSRAQRRAPRSPSRGFAGAHIASTARRATTAPASARETSRASRSRRWWPHDSGAAFAATVFGLMDMRSRWPCPRGARRQRIRDPHRREDRRASTRRDRVRGVGHRAARRSPIAASWFRCRWARSSIEGSRTTRSLVAKSAREALSEQGFRRPFSLSAWRARASLARSTTAPRLRAARSRRRWVGRGPRAFLRGP